LLPDTAEAGIVITLHQSPKAQGEKAAELVVMVMLDKKNSNLKPEVLRNTELVFNLKEAKNLGLSLPINLIAEATRVIK
jgi:ABC-type uncharacterized transport system substrate-binding protein